VIGGLEPGWGGHAGRPVQLCIASTVGRRFTDITVAVAFDGATYALAESSGTADVDAGTVEFSGTAMGEGTEISGSLDCG
jgi:hypothetical protein